MKSIKVLVLVMAFGVGMMSSTIAHADLVGATVNVSAFYPDSDTPYSDPGDVLVVDPGVEYEAGSYSSYNSSWEVDITGTQMIITDTLGTGLPFFGGVDFNGFILEMISGPKIISASVDKKSTIIPIELTVVGSRVLVNFMGVDEVDFGSAIINIVTVPAPGALGAFALLGLIGQRRRRRST